MNFHRVQELTYVTKGAMRGSAHRPMFGLGKNWKDSGFDDSPALLQLRGSAYLHCWADLTLILGQQCR